MNKHIAFRIVELAMNKAKSHEEMKFYVMAILEGYKMALKELNEISPEQTEKETKNEQNEYPEIETENNNGKSEIIDLIKKYSKKSKYNDCTPKQRQAIYKALGRRKIKLTNELKNEIRKLDRKLASKILDKLYEEEDDEE
jgi:putative protein kinase ArgK-like GTPase of G3E family